MATAQQLRDRLNAITDGQFAMQVEFLPYHKTKYMSAPAPDPGRAVTSGYGQLIGRATFLRGLASTASMTQRADADFLLNCQQKYLTGVKQGDHVKLLGFNNEECEISYTEVGKNDRTILHLIRKKRQ